MLQKPTALRYCVVVILHAKQMLRAQFYCKILMVLSWPSAHSVPPVKTYIQKLNIFVSNDFFIHFVWISDMRVFDLEGVQNPDKSCFQTLTAYLLMNPASFNCNREGSAKSNLTAVHVNVWKPDVKKLYLSKIWITALAEQFFRSYDLGLCLKVWFWSGDCLYGVFEIQFQT